MEKETNEVCDATKPVNMKSDHDIENRFSYHAPNDAQIESYSRIRDAAKWLAYLLSEECPQSRELSKALTDLESCMMFANAAIARKS